MCDNSGSLNFVPQQGESAHTQIVLTTSGSSATSGQNRTFYCIDRQIPEEKVGQGKLAPSSWQGRERSRSRKLEEQEEVCISPPP
jgi:hypothetical protein